MTVWNHQTLVLHPSYAHLGEFMLSLPRLFAEGEGRLIHDGRNKLRRIEHGGRTYVVKQYRRPNPVNRLVYGTLRPSKALRAYRNALSLIAIGVGTPEPVGYLNLRSGLLFDQSYLVTVASDCPYRYEDLFTQHFPYADDVLRAVGRLTAQLHTHGMAHKDYGRANILFAPETDGSVRLELVDLNRMHFGPLGLKAGCKNFERLPATPHMHRLMAEAYAEARGFDADVCYRLISHYRSVQPGKIDGKY